MKVSELPGQLESRGYGAECYRILEPPDDMTWCIRKYRKTWMVFYFERGRRDATRRFKVEDDACEYFLSHFPYASEPEPPMPT